MSPVGRLLQQHPHWTAASHVLETLAANGFEAWLAGGCVRDACLGTTAQDLDIATSATPDQVLALFRKTVEVGKSFGVVRVLEGGADLEVATFRQDGAYADGRRPETVAFTTAREDAFRRDFTVNALFYDPRADRVEDFVGGLEDLHRRVLRTVGEPARRFAEDHLRLLRAVRFAVQLGFSIESGTWQEVRARASTIRSVSGERVRDELFKMLKKGGELGPRLFLESGLSSALFPSLEPFAKDLIEGARRLATCVTSSEMDFVFARWLAPVLVRDPSFDVEPLIGPLKLSRADANGVRRRLEVVARPEELRALSLGAGLRVFDDLAVREGWNLREALSGADPARARFESAWREKLVDGKLPRPILGGNDLKDCLRGPALGEALRVAYEAQLEGLFTDLPGALAWVRERTGDR